MYDINLKQQEYLIQSGSRSHNTTMEQTDFMGIYKWKFLIPFLYLINWLLMIIGPFYFTYQYQIYCIIIIIYSILKTLGIALGTFISIIKIQKTFNSILTHRKDTPLNKQSKNINLQQIFHVIIIPSYQQDHEVLLQTIYQLAKNKNAKSQFIIMLAMEAHEKDSDKKAQIIINQCKDKFFFIGFTLHNIKQDQFKGKASNVSSCVEKLQTVLGSQLIQINMDSIMLTIIDADSWAPVEYFEAVEIQLSNQPEIRHRSMFSPPQIFNRNHLQVPAISRTYDNMHSIAHLSNLVGFSYFFPLSNYTISYNLMKNIEWWDKCADAIGEDFHTCQKCYWKQQNFVTIPIYIPFNQLSLSTGKGYLNDLRARFEQAKRHTLGVSDVAYCWNMLFNNPFKLKHLILTLLVTQIFAAFTFMPWAFIQIGIQYKILTNQQIKYFPMWFIDLLLNIPGLFTILSYFFYQYWKRSANGRIWKRENDHWCKMIQYPILFGVALIVYTIPSFIWSSFSVLTTKIEYHVAQKHIELKQMNNNYLREELLKN